ncbi:MAG: TlpA family protein disulfide reductase [Syntrophaceae bacterium]|nr:TlpA family protein disulfide reductase [Syntrophaceae bacterium]
MKKGLGSLFVVLAWVLLCAAMLRAESPPSQKSSSAWESFGIQRLEPKKGPIHFSLKDLKGNPVSLSDYKGKPLLLFFWATWCGACKEDIVLLEKFIEGKKDQLEILAIAIDGERRERIKRIVDKCKITIPVLLVLKEKILDDYGVWGWVPVTYLVDGEGCVVGKAVGQRAWSSPEAWSAIKEIFSLR